MIEAKIFFKKLKKLYSHSAQIINCSEKIEVNKKQKYKANTAQPPLHKI